MTIAEHVKKCCENAIAFTLDGGYAVLGHGKRNLFPPASIKKERRNEKGRCTYALAEYADGSALIFKYHPNHGVFLSIRKA